MASDRQHWTPPEWQHWVERLWVARRLGDLEACLALREEDAGRWGPEDLARALDEERRWHAEREPAPAPWVPLSVRHGGPMKKAAWRLKGWRTGWALRIAPWLGGHNVR